MIRRKWGALLLLLVAPHTDTTVSGDDGFSLPNHVRQAIVQIDNRGHGGGSGTYLGAGYVLTCDHLFRDSRTGQNEVGRVVVSFPTGQASTATLLQQHRVWDLALLKLDAPPPGVAPIDLATDYPQPGETVISCGYGRDGQFYGNVGQVTGYGRDKYLATPLADTMLLTGAARGGDSGGPILNRQGQLVGVLWGSDGRTVVGTQVGQCRRILDQWQCLPAARPQVRPAPRPSGGTTSPPPASSPVPDATQQQLSALQDELAQLRQQLDQLKRGGSVGPPGPPGPAGPRGPQGPSAEIDLPRLADAVRREIAGSIRVKVEPVR